MPVMKITGSFFFAAREKNQTCDNTPYFISGRMSLLRGPVVKLVDTRDLKSLGASCTGSIPVRATSPYEDETNKTGALLKGGAFCFSASSFSSSILPIIETAESFSQSSRELSVMKDYNFKVVCLCPVVRNRTNREQTRVA